MTGGAPFIAIEIINIVILTMMMAVGIAIISLRNLFAVVMLGGVYSLLSAAFFVNLDAVDVSFTEAAVGAGLSTVLMLSAMLLTAREAKKAPKAKRFAPLAVVIATGAVLLYAVTGLPDFGDPSSPANSHVGFAYLEATAKDINIPNVVTAVLASFRGWDTLGEVVVVFTAGLGVFLILGMGVSARDPKAQGRDGPHPSDSAEPKGKAAPNGKGEQA